MTPFRFRAGAALDIRRRQEDDAAAALARAEAHFSEANRACADMEQVRGRAQQDHAAQAARGIDASTLMWHRNWIVRLDATVSDLRESRRVAQDAVTAARQAWQFARRRRLALERMRDRALARHRDTARLLEAKEIDELARIRFTGARTDDGC